VVEISQILRRDWVVERTRWNSLVGLGLFAITRLKFFFHTV